MLRRHADRAPLPLIAVMVGLVGLALSYPATAQPGSPGAESSVHPTITAEDLNLPPLRLRRDRCTTVSSRPPELGPPVLIRGPGASRARVALTYRRTITRSDVCGYDVMFPPEDETGVAVFTRAGRGWRRIAIGALPVESLVLTTLEYEGASVLALGTRRLVIARGTVRFAP